MMKEFDRRLGFVGQWCPVVDRSKENSEKDKNLLNNLKDIQKIQSCWKKTKYKFWHVQWHESK